MDIAPSLKLLLPVFIQNFYKVKNATFERMKALYFNDKSSQSSNHSKIIPQDINNHLFNHRPLS